MHLELFVEEPSAEAALNNLLPRLIGETTTFQIYVHQGKRDLLTCLPDRLRAYRAWLPDDWRIVVLCDSDNADCRALKRQMDQIAQHAGLTTRATAGPESSFQVLNRLAIEELEAWFFGDSEAMQLAYPRLTIQMHRQPFRNPDAIRGGTWEALQRVLQRAGYYRNLRHIPKIEVARAISAHMHPERNRSQSFQAFYQGLRSLGS